MRFKGQLLLPDEPGPGLRVDLELAGQRLAVVSDQERLGAWPLETVEVRRVGSDTFAMTLAGEPLHFVADDTIAFAYSGIPAIETMGTPSQSRSSLRSFFGRLWSGTSQKSRPDPDTPSQTTSGSAVELAQKQTEEGLPNEAIPEGADTVPEALLPTSPPVSPEYQVVIEEWVNRGSEVDWSVGQPFTELDPPPAPEEEPFADAEVIELFELERSLVDAPSDEDAETGMCRALRSDGLPCRSPIIGPSGYCHSHDPERPVADDLRKALEARARLKRKGTARLNRVYTRLDRALRQVENGELDPEKAIAMAQVARTMCAILEMDEEHITGADGGSKATT